MGMMTDRTEPHSPNPLRVCGDHRTTLHLPYLLPTAHNPLMTHPPQWLKWLRCSGFFHRIPLRYTAATLQSQNFPGVGIFQ